MRHRLALRQMTRVILILACWFTSTPPCAFAQDPTATKIKEAEAAIYKAVFPDSRFYALADFAACHIRAALWGDYDVVVRVDAAVTADGKYRRFAVSKGRFISTEATGAGVGLASVNRKGHITLINQEVAFARGVPLFISDVVVNSPTEIAYTVTSNPHLKVDGVARVEFEWISDHSRVEVFETPRYKWFSSDDKPIKKTFQTRRGQNPGESRVEDFPFHCPN